MFESAAPLAQLYSPLFAMDDTFVLQEYFVPAARYADWIAAVKPIYASLCGGGEGGGEGSGEGGEGGEGGGEGSGEGGGEGGEGGGEGGGGARRLLHLLNTTVRYVEEDRETLLSYASTPGG